MTRNSLYFSDLLCLFNGKINKTIVLKLFCKYNLRTVTRPGHQQQNHKHYFHNCSKSYFLTMPKLLVVPHPMISHNIMYSGDTGHPMIALRSLIGCSVRLWSPSEAMIVQWSAHKSRFRVTNNLPLWLLCQSKFEGFFSIKWSTVEIEKNYKVIMTIGVIVRRFMYIFKFTIVVL